MRFIYGTKPVINLAQNLTQNNFVKFLMKNNFKHPMYFNKKVRTSCISFSRHELFHKVYLLFQKKERVKSTLHTIHMTSNYYQMWRLKIAFTSHIQILTLRNFGSLNDFAVNFILLLKRDNKSIQTVRFHEIMTIDVNSFSI